MKTQKCGFFSTLICIKLHHCACPPVKQANKHMRSMKTSFQHSSQWKENGLHCQREVFGLLGTLLWRVGVFCLSFCCCCCSAFEKSTCAWEWTNCMNIAPAGKLTMGSSSTGRAQISRKKFNKAFYWDVCVFLEFCACLGLFVSRRLILCNGTSAWGFKDHRVMKLIDHLW